MLRLLSSEQLNRIRALESVKIRRPEGAYIFRLIKASEARNYDGTFAGWDDGDPRKAIEVKFCPKKGKSKYTNIWGQ